MRVLAFADLYGKHSVYEWRVRTAAEYHVDAIVLGGDLFGGPEGFPLRNRLNDTRRGSYRNVWRVVKALEGLLDADTIFVSHSPALGILDAGVGETRIGSSSLRDLLQRHPVRVHVHGHSHASFGRHGFHLNVASRRLQARDASGLGDNGTPGRSRITNVTFSSVPIRSPSSSRLHAVD